MGIHMTHRIISSGSHWKNWSHDTRLDDDYLKISAVGFDICRHGKQKNIFRRSQWQRNKKLVDNCTQETQKYPQNTRNNLCVFALRNYLEGYKINKSLSGLVVYRSIVLSAEKLSSKCHKYLKALLLGQLFIFWTILQPWALSSGIPAAERGLFSYYIGLDIKESAWLF